MSEHIHAFCDECMQMVDAEVRAFPGKQPMRGMELEVTEMWPVCPICGNKIAVGTYAQANDEAIYSAYRKYWKVPTGDEIRAFRESLGLSQQAFASLLGVGVATVQRYEKGSLPTEAHVALIKRIFDPVSQRELLDDASIANVDERKRVALSIDNASSPSVEAESLSQRVFRMMERVPSELTGGIGFSRERFAQLLAYLAANATNLFRTKLNKVLFYIDFSMYRDHGAGITGLRYAHADYGPVPDKYEMLLSAALATGPFWYEENENGGQILKTSVEAPSLEGCSADEIAQIDNVVAYANSFETAKAMANASHEEDAWKRTSSGELISYEWARTLKGAR